MAQYEFEIVEARKKKGKREKIIGKSGNDSIC